MSGRSAAPVGRPTRGKTARNRLRRTDTWLLLDRPGRLRSLPARYVDVGFGAEPSTTVETLERLAPHWPGLVVVGVEIHPDRVAEAAPAAVPGRLEFRLGGFALPLGPDEPVGVARALNVLRQYDEHEHAPAVALLGRSLAPGGVLLEGTCSPTGRLLTFHVYRRPNGAAPAPASGGPVPGALVPEAPAPESLVPEALVLSVNPRRPWEPRELQTVLPKDLIHRCGPGTPLEAFFAAFERAVTPVRAAGASTGDQLVAAAEALVPGTTGGDALAAAGLAVDPRRTLLRRGFLPLRPLPPPGVL